jgi:hypothetical protein
MGFDSPLIGRTIELVWGRTGYDSNWVDHVQKEEFRCKMGGYLGGYFERFI